MKKEQIISIINKEISPLITSGSMSVNDRFWIRDGNTVYTARDGFHLSELTAEDIISLPLTEVFVMNDSLSSVTLPVLRLYPHIKTLFLNRSRYSLSISQTGETLKPYVDDIAQIIGIDIKSLPLEDAGKIIKLFKSRSAVTIMNEGILCAGSSPEDAAAVSIIAEKAAYIHIQGSYLGRLNYIGKFESALMRFIYRKKYSKQAEIKSRG